VAISTELLRDPIVVVGIAMVVCLKVVDMAKTHNYRSKQMNGENPVVAQLKVLTDAVKDHNETMKEEHRRTREVTSAEHQRTREKTVECFQRSDVRMKDHEGREEGKWDEVLRNQAKP
jgi:hypothetical protein